MIGVPAAWAFAKWKVTWTRYLFGFYIILMLIPFQVSMVPEYLTLSNMGLIDTQLSVILPGMFAAFPIFIMTRFFSAVPDELMEAARLDGANEFYIFFRIGLHLGKQGIGAAVILSFDYIAGPFIDQCFVKNGEAVRTGDALCQYNKESLDKYVEDKKIELLENNFLLYQIANEEYREILYSRIDVLRREMDSLEQLQIQDDYIKSDVNEWIIGIDENGIGIGTGAVSVRGEVTGYYEDPNKLIDMPVNVNIGSAVQGKMTDCTWVGANLSCTIEIDEMVLYVPKATYALEWAGETYQICLPKEVLHIESGEFFVYIVEEKRGILGSTYVATKRNVTLLNSNDELVAVEGNLSVTERIISYSDKELFDGCAVVLGDF